jgi:hypothetical protein
MSGVRDRLPAKGGVMLAVSGSILAQHVCAGCRPLVSRLDSLSENYQGSNGPPYTRPWDEYALLCDRCRDVADALVEG